LESKFLYGPRKDESLNVYNLEKFEPEVLVLNKLFENNELSYTEKMKLQNMVHIDKVNEAAVFFTEFLENLNTRKNRMVRINEQNYCFSRDMIYKIVQRRLIEKSELALLFKMIYQFQFLKFELNGVMRKASDDLQADEIFQNDDFWLNALYTIFEKYKNRKTPNGAQVKEMLLMNFSSLKEIRKSQKNVLEIMKKVISLSLGFQIEQILDEMEVRPKTAITLIFYRESDIDNKRQLQIFT
jgi:hypothetical protein